MKTSIQVQRTQSAYHKSSALGPKSILKSSEKVAKIQRTLPNIFSKLLQHVNVFASQLALCILLFCSLAHHGAATKREKHALHANQSYFAQLFDGKSTLAQNAEETSLHSTTSERIVDHCHFFRSQVQAQAQDDGETREQ